MSRTPIWKHRGALSKWWFKNALNLLKSHRTILTVASAIVVLGSFVLKEVWDEHLRGLEDKIKISQERAERRDAASLVLLKIYSVQTGVDEIRDAAKKKPPEQFDQHYRYMSKTEVFEEEIDAELEIVDGQLPALRDHISLDKKREELRKLAQAFHEKRLTTSSTKNNETEEERDARDFADVQAERGRLLEKAYKLDAEITEEEEIELRDYERKHNWILRLTYFFFGLGWILGLVASFIGGGVPERS